MSIEDFKDEPDYSNETEYRYIETEDEFHGKLLVGPGNFQCRLGEPEDCTWWRDGSAAMHRLNKQHIEILSLQKKIAELEEALRNSKP